MDCRLEIDFFLCTLFPAQKLPVVHHYSVRYPEMADSFNEPMKCSRMLVPRSTFCSSLA